MKKILFHGLVATICLVAMTGCGDSGRRDALRKEMEAIYGVNRELPDTTVAYPHAVKCHNGVFLGRDSAGVVSFKGIPYAVPPTGKLRWKPPVPAPESDEVREAYFFGLTPIQTEVTSQPGSFYKQGEDCLTLNVWTSSLPPDTLRPVMVFIHGGSYGWGSTSDPLFDGHNLVKAHPEVVLVTVEYRLGLLGFIDLSMVEGGEHYRESGNLGLLDQACALQWVKHNISGFGGDPDNVTIFGESAGGGSVSLLPLMKESAGLFRRYIAESGSVALTYSREECRKLTEELLRETGARNMADLLSLTSEQIVEVNNKISRYDNFPERDGIVLPEDLYAAYRDGAARDIGMLVGTNADELRYWIRDLGGVIPFRIAANVLFENDTRLISAADMRYVDAFMATQHEGRVWDITEFYNELLFRVPAVTQAAYHADCGGETYVYYWTYPSALTHLGACHTVELPYVFGNLDVTTITGNNIDPELSRQVQQMWVNYATTGNPGIAGHPWPRYDTATRTSMVLGRDIHAENDILGPQRKDIEPLLKYGFNGDQADLSFAIPYVYKLAAIAVAILAAIVAVVVWVVRRVRKPRK